MGAWGLVRPVILSERSESKDLADYGAPIACQRQNRMSFRAVKDGVASSPNGGIFPIAVCSLLSPALEIDATIPQPARPFDYAQGDRFYLALARNRCTVIGKIPPSVDAATAISWPLNDILTCRTPQSALRADDIRPNTARRVAAPHATSPPRSAELHPIC